MRHTREEKGREHLTWGVHTHIPLHKPQWIPHDDIIILMTYLSSYKQKHPNNTSNHINPTL